MENQTNKSEATTATQNPFKPDLSRVSAEYLAAELYRRMRAGECVGLILTPGDLAEYWECDESGATHPGSRVPEAEEMHAIRKAFERWQDTGGFHDIMHTCRDAWQAEQARQLDTETPWAIELREHPGEPVFWSNQDGWADAENADRFTDAERQTLNLPIGGAWVRMERGRA